MGQPKLDAQVQREVFVPQGLSGSCLQCPWFQQAGRCPCGFVSAWSGLHNPWLMLVCAGGLLRVEQNLVAQVYQSLQIQRELWFLELISAWEIVTMQSAFLQKQGKGSTRLFAFQNLQLCTMFHLPVKIQHHPSEELLLFLEKLGKKKPNIPSPPKSLQTSESLTDGFEQNPIFSCNFCQITRIRMCYWQFWDLIYVVIFMLRGRKAFRDIEAIIDTMFFHFKERAKNNFVEKEKLHAYWDCWLIVWRKMSQL